MWFITIVALLLQANASKSTFSKRCSSYFKLLKLYFFYCNYTKHKDWHGKTWLDSVLHRWLRMKGQFGEFPYEEAAEYGNIFSLKIWGSQKWTGIDVSFTPWLCWLPVLAPSLFSFFVCREYYYTANVLFHVNTNANMYLLDFDKSSTLV